MKEGIAIGQRGFVVGCQQRHRSMEKTFKRPAQGVGLCDVERGDKKLRLMAEKRSTMPILLCACYKGYTLKAKPHRASAGELVTRENSPMKSRFSSCTTSCCPHCSGLLVSTRTSIPVCDDRKPAHTCPRLPPPQMVIVIAFSMLL